MYKGRQIGTKEDELKFLKKPKSISYMKDLDNGYTISDISKMRDYSFGTIYKVIKLRKIIS